MPTKTLVIKTSLGSRLWTMLLDQKRRLMAKKVVSSADKPRNLWRWMLTGKRVSRPTMTISHLRPGTNSILTT